MSVVAPASSRRHDVEVAARFDESEARFKTTVAAGDVRLAGIIRAIGPVAGLRILDLGCGKGRFAAPLADLGARVVGVDLSQAMLAAAVGLDRARASARRLPFVDGGFDAVVAVEVLEHVGQVEPVLREARRVLGPAGRLVIVDKNILAVDARRPWLPAAAIKWLDERRGRWMYPIDGPVRERWFVPRTLQAAIRRAGFAPPAVDFLLGPAESRRWVHRRIPAARLLTCWSAGRADDEGGPR